MKIAKRVLAVAIGTAAIGGLSPAPVGATGSSPILQYNVMCADGGMIAMVTDPRAIGRAVQDCNSRFGGVERVFPVGVPGLPYP
jgi:hypothetical protein